MKRILILLIASQILTPKSWAEDAPLPADSASYLEQLQLKLDHAAQRANQPSSGGSSVVGLRGAKQESVASPLYWKGRITPAPVSTEELKEFRASIELARSGKNDEATAGLKTFIAKYPTSPFRSDAEESLKQLAASKSVPTPLVTKS